ncbi:malonate transporter MadL subunit [Acinetobacter sp. NBRC 100985]|nr:malonate transporter MadL subunit [Acinetobacter sp. NBRC 100985]
MIIYGTAILAICHLLGDYFGNTLGMLLGVKANVGGVAISMLLLILAKELLAKKVIYHKSLNSEFYIGLVCTFQS